MKPRRPSIRFNLHKASVAKRKLTREQVLEILERRAQGETLETLATHYGVNDTTISDICAFRRWRGVGMLWDKR